MSHSKSPAMHAAAFRALGLPHSYEAMRVGPEQLADVVRQLRDGVFDGFNITVPHKQRILEFVDTIAPSAAVAGAANTLVRKADGSIVAHNTDSPAVAIELRRLAPEATGEWSSARALVIGSGGVARSAVAGLAMELKVESVVVRARAFSDRSRAGQFVDGMRALLARAGAQTAIEAADLSSRGDEPSLRAIVQATSAGMTGGPPGEAVSRAVAWAELPARAVALEVVYTPPETPFLKAALAHGIRGVNGIGMLARQGALAFELWLGAVAPFNAMLTALV